ncbi:MAG TPA: preprotein translocase subunit YajC [Candidatus Limnocylindria bacterium]|nr:preprotein translocase subunit YajC [Candidatus Limnocylindria bacterium]
MTTTTFAALAIFAPAGGNTLLGPLFMYGAIFIIFYFVLIRPGQKQRKAHEALIKALKKGDEVVTAGGLVGEVLHIKETMKEGTPAPTMEDRVTVRSGESKIVIERGRITKVIRPTTPGA